MFNRTPLSFGKYFMSISKDFFFPNVGINLPADSVSWTRNLEYSSHAEVLKFCSKFTAQTSMGFCVYAMNAYMVKWNTRISLHSTNWRPFVSFTSRKDPPLTPSIEGTVRWAQEAVGTFRKIQIPPPPPPPSPPPPPPSPPPPSPPPPAWNRTIIYWLFRALPSYCVNWYIPVAFVMLSSFICSDTFNIMQNLNMYNIKIFAILLTNIMYC